MQAVLFSCYIVAFVLMPRLAHGLDCESGVDLGTLSTNETSSTTRFVFSFAGTSQVGLCSQPGAKGQDRLVFRNTRCWYNKYC